MSAFLIKNQGGIDSELYDNAHIFADIPANTILELFGKMFFEFCQDSGYDKILQVLGATPRDFLQVSFHLMLKKKIPSHTKYYTITVSSQLDIIIIIDGIKKSHINYFKADNKNNEISEGPFIYCSSYISINFQQG